MRGDQGKYPHVARLIKSRIVRGVYVDRLPGEDRLAAELNVSPGTVRTALAYLEGQGFVRRARRQGTFVLHPKRGSAELREAFIRVFVGAYQQSVWAAPVLDVFRETADAHGLTTLVTDLGRSGATDDPREHEAPRDGWQAEVLSRAAEPRSVGSVLLLVPVKTGDALELVDARSPVIVVDWEMPEAILSSVVFDNKGGGALAARHLVQLGHRRIGWVQRGVRINPNEVLRLAAIKETLAQAGLKLAFEIPWETSDAFSKQLKSFLADPHPLTAIICQTVALLTTMVTLVRGTGRRVPEDVSIVGIGAPRDSILPIYPTMVSLGHGMMGKRAVELLLDEDALINPRREVIPCQLELGSTSAQAPSPR